MEMEYSPSSMHVLDDYYYYCPNNSATISYCRQMLLLLLLLVCFSKHPLIVLGLALKCKLVVELLGVPGRC